MTLFAVSEYLRTIVLVCLSCSFKALKTRQLNRFLSLCKTLRLMHKAAEKFKEESLGVFLLRDQCGSTLAANGLFTLSDCDNDNGSFSKELNFTKT